MATKSIYKEIRIKDPIVARNFIRALEKAKNKQSTDIVMSKKVHDIRDPEEVSKIFGR